MSERRTRSAFRLLLIGVLALLALSPAFAGSPRRVLRVSLYPYIPAAPAAALALKQGFERLHPDVIVDITFNRHSYDTDPAAKGALYEDADVHEFDVVFLRDFIDRHKLAPLSPAFVRSIDRMTPVAAKAATIDGRLVGVPHWLCGDFLIYRADQTDLAGSPTLADLERQLRPDHGLLMNMKSLGALGEYYLISLLARDGSPEAAVSDITATPDPVILDRFQRILALEPAGFGRNPDDNAREDFYARQFARGAGSAFLGYSELIHDALDETASGCRAADHCVTAADIRVAPFPFQDGRVRPTVFEDLFGIDARVHGRTLKDAEDFIRYAVSVRGYRALLVPESGENPRYLLPATEAAFDDPRILAAGPLYPKLRAIIDQGVVMTAPHLNDRLHDVAVRIDASLPGTH
jgi:thiamine pyridinylase